MLFIQLLGLRFDAFQHILRLFAAPHHDDAFDGIIRFVEAELAQARRVSDGNIAPSFTSAPAFCSDASMPNSAGYVAFSEAVSLPAVFPSCSEVWVTSRTSSTI